MKNITTSFKEEIKTFGKQQEVQIIYGENVITSENLNSINLYYKGDLLKSVMKGLNIDSNINIPKDTELCLRYGLFVNGEYEYINYGNFIVYDSEKQEDTNSYLLTCYDKLLYSMKNYEAMNITYPITVENYLKAICKHLGLEYEQKAIANANRIIPSELYLSYNEDEQKWDSLDYTFRDVLDEISQVTAGTICMNKDDKLEVRYINYTEDTIDEEYLKDINVNFGQKYGKINSVVLSRSAGTDNVYLLDVPSVEENGLCEIKISDNQIMNFNDRSDYLPEILEKVKGIEYFVNDFSSTGIMYYDLLDSYNVKIGDKTYKCLMLNDEINITQGLEELVYTEMPETSETDYTKADKTDRRINQTYLIVDKQNKQIESVVSETTKQNEKINRITQTVDELNSKISDVADLTVSAQEINAKVMLNDINESEPIRVVIRPTGENISYLYPRENLFPSENLFTKTRTLRFENTKTQEIFDYELPDDLYFYNTDYYDEFILDYESQTCLINKKVGFNEQGQTYILENPRTIEYDEYPKINLTSGNYTISLVGYNYGYLFVRLMATNIYTTQFATKAELSSEIKQLSDEISLEVSQKVNDDEIIASLNVAVKNKQGILELIGNVLKIATDNFNLTSDGHMTAKAGTIAGWNINESYLGKGLAGIKGISNTTSNDDVFYAGKDLGYDGNPAFHVTNQGDTHVKSLSIRGRNSSDIGEIKVYNENAQVGSTIDYSTIDTYNLIAGNGGTTPTKGKAMHGYNMYHDYRCNWQDSKLYFIIDDYNMGYVTSSSSDARLKKDIKKIPQELMLAIEEIELKQFKLIKGNGKYKFGIIAQDLVSAFAKYDLDYRDFEVISETQIDLTDETLYFTIDYEQILILKNQLLENKLKALEDKVEKILKFMEGEK